MSDRVSANTADLERAWLHPAATAATRKRILRAALTEIVVRRDGAIIHAVLHWQGGDHTQLQVKQRLNAAGRHNPRIPDDTIALVRELARLMPDRQIARLLNRTGVETGHANAWTQDRVRGFRNHHDIAVFRDSEWAERGEITLEAAAKLIGVCNMTALRMLRRGDIKGRQACAGAPWVIRAGALAGFAKGKRRKPPLTPDATMLFAGLPKVDDRLASQMLRFDFGIVQELCHFLFSTPRETPLL